MNKLLVICGPTATGKTDLAIKLAKKYDGEVVSTDSRQVYKGMDVGTGKDISKFTIYNLQFTIKDKKRIGYYLINSVRIWLYDIVEPDYQFNVADYKECADLVVSDILNRGKLPILIGGTGLYIKAMVDGIETIGVPPDWELRKRLLNCSIVELLNLLRRLDLQKAEQMNDSDKNNPRRLVRAIEIALWKSEMRGGKLDNEVGSERKNSHISLHNPASNFPRLTSALFIGLTAPYKILYKKIDQRVEERLKNGAIDEIKKLLALGYNFKNSVLGTTIGYREWQAYFESKSTTDEVINKWKFAEHAYARRQMTWFKKDKRINWFDISKNDWEIKVEKLLKKWLGNIVDDDI